MISFLTSLNSFVWGVPVLMLILFVGLRLSVQTGFVQIRRLPDALKEAYRSITNKQSASGMSAYRALCTALAGTVGTGNLAGVAGAICIGGPGAIFWMWICGMIGMVIKFAEVILAVHYRQKDSTGAWIGGSMYIIQQAMPDRMRFLAGVYCFLGVAASIGVGNTVQINTFVTGVNEILANWNHPPSMASSVIIGILMALFVYTAFRKGSGRIGFLAQILVPAATGLYIILAFGVILMNAHHIPNALMSIVSGAFNPRAVTGGMVGSLFTTIRIGTSRGVFTNEAGMGTASIAHAESSTNSPVLQGYLGMIEVFLDTLVICTLTAFAILCSGIPIPYGEEYGIELTLAAFSSVYGSWILFPVTVIICLLATATILGWGLYAVRCAQYLFGEKIWSYFTAIHAIAVFAGALMNTSSVWLISELMNGLMAIPNLIMLIYMTPVFVKIVKASRL